MSGFKMKTIKMKSFNRVKIFRSAVITLLLIFIMVFTIKTSASGLAPDSYTEITVCPGDTLWSISKEYKPGDNIEKTIYEIMEFNNMDKCDIFPGQKLKIPLKY